MQDMREISQIVNEKISDLVHDFMNFNALKIASIGRQEPQPAGTAKWPTTLRFGKILGRTSVVRSIENP